jgi:predicted nucleic acid-binding protein
MAARMKVFVDTSGLLAALDAEDPNHDAATEMFEALLQRHELFTHNYIHVEAEQLVRRRLGALQAARLLFQILPAIDTVWVGEDVHRDSVAALFGKGRAESLVDQVSFMLMRQLHVTTALAFDSDFEREGFPRPEVPPRHALSETKARYGSTADAPDLVSVSELAARSNRSVNTIQSWRRRHDDFPQPNVELAAGPIWLWGDVSAWIDQRARRSAGGGSR